MTTYVAPSNRNNDPPPTYIHTYIHGTAYVCMYVASLPACAAYLQCDDIRMPSFNLFHDFDPSDAPICVCMCENDDDDDDDDDDES